MTNFVQATITSSIKWDLPDEKIYQGDVVVEISPGLEKKSCLSRKNETVSWYMGICAQSISYPTTHFVTIVNGIVLISNYRNRDIAIGRCLSYSLPRETDTQFIALNMPYRQVELKDKRFVQLEETNVSDIHRYLDWSLKEDDPVLLSLLLIWRYCLALEIYRGVTVNLSADEELHYDNLYHLLLLRFDFLPVPISPQHRVATLYGLHAESTTSTNSALIISEVVREFENCLKLCPLEKLAEISRPLYKVPDRFVPPHKLTGSRLPREGLTTVSERIQGVALDSAYPSDLFQLCQTPHFKQVFRF